MAETQPSQPPHPYRLRYLRVMLLFAGAYLEIVFWDLLVRRIPLVGIMARRTALKRWVKIAHNLRETAVRMGGMLIKMGQFLSSRVDMLPQEVTSELAGLQDEIPPEKFEDVLRVIEEEFGKPVGEVFSRVEPESVGAASLAQVHLARLHSGEEVAVKVQRPNIGRIIETDLAALSAAVNWLKPYKAISSRVDVDSLLEEFVHVTFKELDFVNEGQNAEKFADNFADNEQIYAPRVYHEYTTTRVLTMENVAHVKIDDVRGIEAAGLDRCEVADVLYQCYLEQFFVNNFVHSDPHPGNLFVRPLPHPPGADPDSPPPCQVVFVDFGMMATVPQRMREHFRDYAIGVATRDAKRIVRAYQDSGIILPGADVRRLEEVTQTIFNRYWGIKMGDIRDIAYDEVRYFLREYRDVIYEMPMQFPSDILFVMRAVPIVAGLVTAIDPAFDPWVELIPMGERLLAEEGAKNWRELLQEMVEFLRVLHSLPAKTEQLLEKALSGDLQWKTSLAPDAARAMDRLERATNGLKWGVVFAAFLISGVMLEVEGMTWPGHVLIALAVLALLKGLL